MLLHQSTWMEIEAFLDRSKTVVVPIGSNEQHGPTGLLGTDWMCPEIIAHEAQKSAELLVAPTFNIGMAQHHLGFPGTIALRPSTFMAAIGDWCRSLSSYGFEKLYFLNGHGGNTTALQNMIGELTVEYKLPLATGTYWDIAAKSIAKLLEKQKALLHACEAETSMIMAMAPELVNPDELSQMHGPYIPGLSAIPGVNEGVYRWRQLSSRSPIGVIGDAGTASADKGEKLLKAISADVAEALSNERLWSEPI